MGSKTMKIRTFETKLQRLFFVKKKQLRLANLGDRPGVGRPTVGDRRTNSKSKFLEKYRDAQLGDRLGDRPSFRATDEQNQISQPSGKYRGAQIGRPVGRPICPVGRPMPVFEHRFEQKLCTSLRVL